MYGDKMRKKGYLYTLEVFIALSMIFLTLVFVFRNPPLRPELEISLIKQQGFEVLEYLDYKGVLRQYVSNSDEVSIENSLSSLLSSNIAYETEICASSCLDSNVPVNETVIAVDYYIAGYRDAYLGKKVRLWMWRL